MTLYFRLLYLLVVSRFRSKVGYFGLCRTPFRVWPSDLDLFMHMNNAKYFSLMDLARTDLMIRNGLLGKLHKVGWYPVVAAQWIDFFHSLNPWQRFEIETGVIAWDDRYVYLQQRFVVGKREMARAIVVGRFRRKTGGGVSPAELLELIGEDRVSPPLPQDVENWRARA